MGRRYQKYAKMPDVLGASSLKSGYRCLSVPFRQIIMDFLLIFLSTGRDDKVANRVSVGNFAPYAS